MICLAFALVKNSNLYRWLQQNRIRKTLLIKVAPTVPPTRDQAIKYWLLAGDFKHWWTATIIVIRLVIRHVIVNSTRRHILCLVMDGYPSTRAILFYKIEQRGSETIGKSQISPDAATRFTPAISTPSRKCADLIRSCLRYIDPKVTMHAITYKLICSW
jgi:hypothetical protein